MTDIPDLPREGDIVAGRFRIEGVLGEGGMGTVFEATQVNLERPVALKILLPEHGVREDARQRFEREARVAAALHHKNAVTILDFGEDRGRLFLAMERLEGKTLREVLNATNESSGLEVDLAIDIVAQICSVLVAAHGLGLVHRDLKPENIFLDRDEKGGLRVVVVDFGLAFIRNREGVDRMTQEGVLSGTPEYISPEQVRAGEVSPSADVYALGCVFHEMLTGSVPFKGESAFELFSQHVYVQPPRIRDLCPTLSIPACLDDLVGEMLAKNADQRPSAQRVLDALDVVRAERGSRERVRGETTRQGREARMVPPPKKALETTTLTMSEPSADAQAEIIVVGDVQKECRTALLVNGIAVRTVDAIEGDVARASAIYAPGAPIELLERLRGLQLPLLSDAVPSDFERVSALLALGISDVVPAPARGDELAKKIWRAIRKSRRQERAR